MLDMQWSSLIFYNPSFLTTNSTIYYMDCISIPHSIVSDFTNLIVGQFSVESAFLTNHLMSGKNSIGLYSVSTQQLTNLC